jgi:adenosylhomocysteine nucleosidase
MVAALEREVKPLIRTWQRVEREYDGRAFKFFERNESVLVCGGIGAEAGRRSAEAVIALYRPALICSVGFAGAIDPGLKVGDVITARRVVDARDGSCTDTGEGNGSVVSSPYVAGPQEKVKLGEAYGAQAVDMEGAAVAEGARARSVSFGAVKVISDERGFAMPPIEKFVDSRGRLRSMRLVLYLAVRPRWWPSMIRLGLNSRRASVALSRHLEKMLSVTPAGPVR